MLDSTRLVKALGLLIALFLVGALAAGGVLVTTGASTSRGHAFFHGYTLVAGGLFVVGAVALLVDLVLGVRSGRLSATQVSAHRTVAVLLTVASLGAATGDHPSYLPVLGAGVCALATFFVRRPRTPAPGPHSPATDGTKGGSQARSQAASSGTPASVPIDGVATAVSWHLPHPAPGAGPADPERRLAWAVVGDPVDLRTPLPTGARLDYDTDTWLKAPYDPLAYDAWVDAALGRAVHRYGVARDSHEAIVLKKMLTAFVTRDVGSPNRLLRFGDELGDAPLVATCSVLVGLEESTAEHVFASYLPGQDYHHEPRTKVVDSSRHLVRALRQTKEGSDDARLIVRYHRRVSEVGSDLMLGCKGAPLIAASQALGDLDTLAAALWVLDADGRQR